MGIMEHTKSHQGYPINSISASNNNMHSPISPQQLTGQLQLLSVNNNNNVGHRQQQQQQQQPHALPKANGRNNSNNFNGALTPIASPINNHHNGNMNASNGHISSTNSDAGSVAASVGRVQIHQRKKD